MTTLTQPSAPVVPVSRSYFHSLRDGGQRWWKPVVIIVAVVLGYLLVNVVLTMTAFGIEAATRGVSLIEVTSGPVGMTPLVFASALLSLVALLPISLLLYRLLYRARPIGTLFSVTGRFRWRWAGQATLIAMIVIGAASAAVLAIEPRALITDAGPPANPLPWVLIALLIMPLQAGAEEITFRGLLGRSVGALFARAGVGTVIALAVSSVAFGSAHLAGDPWLIAYYLLFGLLMGIVAWRTGGIEAAVALHVVNNVLMGIVGSALDRSIESGIDRSAGAGSPLIMIHLGTLVLTGVILIIAARRLGVATTGPGNRV
jgi:membrane protease YdiL (CAAX protease family)